MANDRNLQQKIRRHRMLTFYWILIAIIIVVAIVFGLYSHWKKIVYTDYEIKQEVDFEKTSEALLLKLGDSVIVYSKDGMSCIDAKGKKIWNQTYEIQNPMVRSCKDVVAIADYNGRNIYVASSNKIIGTISTTMPIRDFSVSANGIVAAVLDDSSVTGIYIFDTSGNNSVYFKTRMSNSGYPVAIDLSADGKQLVISYLKTVSGKITTDIGFYNFSSVGQNYTDNLVAGYGYEDEIIPLVGFMNNDTSFALGDNMLMFYQGSQIPVNIDTIWLDTEIKSVFYDMDYLGLVTVNNMGEEKYLLKVYNTLGKLIATQPFDLDYKDIAFAENGIIIYNDMECVIYNWNQYVKYEGLFKDTVSIMIPTGTVDKYTLITQNSVQNIQLKD